METATTTGGAMQTYMIQARLDDTFEDIYVTATDTADAIRQARTLTTLQHRYTTFAA